MIYIHIPYCDSKCPYCAFNSFAGKFDAKSYIEAVTRQLQNDKKEFGFEKFGSIYIGGGTPSVFEADEYKPLLDQLISGDQEVTIEANPNSADQGWLETIRSLGANRVSFGVQSFDENKLKMLGRIHTADQAKVAIENAKKAGFEEINIDLIYGTTNDTKELLSNDLIRAKDAGATHISAYTLIIEESTPFAKKSSLISDDEGLIRWFVAEIEKTGYPRYEVAAFGKKRSIHNLGYWQGRDYLGIGAGAVGTVGNVRYEPHKNPARYITDPLYKDIERLSDQEKIAEKIMLGLRNTTGFEKSLADQRLLKVLIDSGKVVEKEGLISSADLFLADEIALYLLS